MEHDHRAAAPAAGDARGTPPRARGGNTPEAARAFLAEEVARYRELARVSGVRLGR